MHNIRKYNWGGVTNFSSQWSSNLGLPSSLFTIQNSSNFLNNSLKSNDTSTDWMKNIGKVSNLATVSQPSLGNITSNFNTQVGQIRDLKDIGTLIGGGFNKLLGQGASGANILGGLKEFTGLNPSGVTGIAGDLAGIGLEALGVNKMTASNANAFDKTLDIASKVAGFIPGAGWVASGALQGINLLNKYAGKTAKKQGTADMGYLLGYGQADINQKAGTKFGFSDTIKGWFGKSGKEKADDKTKLFNELNLRKSIPGYNQTQNYLAANNSLSSIQQRNQQQLLGGVNTRMVAAKNGTKIAPAKLRNIVNKVEIEKFKNGGPMNVIPNGAFHSRRNSLPEDISEQVTKKGIPVVTEEDGGLLKQHAEIEKNEIIFHKKATETIENLLDKYNKAESQKEKDSIATECGKYIAKEILVNTDDRTGLINNVE